MVNAEGIVPGCILLLAVLLLTIWDLYGYLQNAPRTMIAAGSCVQLKIIMIIITIIILTFQDSRFYFQWGTWADCKYLKSKVKY